jgi:hypothetical protein
MWHGYRVSSGPFGKFEPLAIRPFNLLPKSPVILPQIRSGTGCGVFQNEADVPVRFVGRQQGTLHIYTKETDRLKQDYVPGIKIYVLPPNKGRKIRKIRREKLY